MAGKLYDNFIVTYDEQGKALAYITHDDGCLWWDLSLPDEAKSKYKSMIDKMEQILFDLRMQQGYPFTDYHGAFVQMAKDLLELIKLTCGDWEKNRVPDFFLNADGGIDFDRIKKLKAMHNFSPKLNVPYYDPKEHSLFAIAPELFLLVKDDILGEDEELELLNVELKEFENILTTDELRFAWFDHRHLAKKFYCFRDDDYDLYMTTNSEDEPVFMVFKSSARKIKRLDAGNKNENSGDNIDSVDRAA